MAIDDEGDASAHRPANRGRSGGDHAQARPPTGSGPRGLELADAGSRGRILTFIRPESGVGGTDPLAARAVMARLACLSVRLVADAAEDDLLLRRLLASAEGVRVIAGSAIGRRPASADATLLATDVEPRALLAKVAARVRQPGVGALLVITELTDPALDVAALAAGAADLLEIEELDTQRLQRAIRLAVARSLLRPPGGKADRA